MLVERGIARIEVLGVHFIGCKSKSLSKSLIMDNLTLTQEFNRITDVRVVDQTQNVVVGRPCFLLCYDFSKATEGLETFDSTEFFGYFDFFYATIA